MHVQVDVRINTQKIRPWKTHSMAPQNKTPIYKTLSSLYIDILHIDTTPTYSYITDYAELKVDELAIKKSWW